MLNSKTIREYRVRKNQYGTAYAVCEHLDGAENRVVDIFRSKKQAETIAGYFNNLVTDLRWADECQGWSNKETASVIMYIENDSAVLKNAYLFCQTYTDNDKLAKELEFWFEPDSSLVLGSNKMLMYYMQVDAHARVDWLEVAQHLRMKHEEHIRG